MGLILLMKPEDLYPLNPVEMAALLGALDNVTLTVRKERVRAHLTLILAETPRNTFSVYAVDKDNKKIYIAERDTRFNAARVYDAAVSLALYGVPKNSTFGKTNRSKK